MRRQRLGLIPAFFFLSAYSAAQDKPAPIKPPLPRIVGASVPFYPELARETHIDGAVMLRVTTDGNRISDVQAMNGPPVLTRAALENLKTWEFQPHTPLTFDVGFRYRLLPVTCDSQCNCESEEKESVLLRLPTSVEVSAKQTMLCDPAVEIHQKR